MVVTIVDSGVLELDSKSELIDCPATLLFNSIIQGTVQTVFHI